MLKWFIAAPEFWLTVAFVVGISMLRLVQIWWEVMRYWVGRVRNWVTARPRRIVLAALAILFSGCATTYRPALSAPGAFTFTLTPEQCATLRTERRAYHATQETALYVSSAGALVATAFLAVPSLREEQVVQGLGAGTGLLAGGVGAFTNAQVSSLDEELALGGCQR